MQNQTNAAPASDLQTALNAAFGAPVSAKPVRAARKPSPAKPAAKLATAKPGTPAKPTQAERDAKHAAQADAHRLARSVASAAVGAFYSGSSKPFKAASDRFADINSANGKSATPRQAALALALITYGAGNMRPDGTFTRGAFIVPAKLINASAKPGETIRAQPESGCLGNMLGRAADYISGPRSGRDQTQAVYRLRLPVCLAEIQAAFGDKPADAAKRMLASFAKRAA